MIGLVYLLLSFVCGRLIWRRLAGNPAELLRCFGLQAPAAAVLAPWLTAASSLTLGLLVLPIITFALAMLSQTLLPTAVYPLLTANIIVFAAAAAAAILLWFRHQHRALSDKYDIASTPKTDLGLPVDSIFERAAAAFRIQRFFLLTLLVFTLYAGWLMISAFHIEGNAASAGASVFSDYSTHTAMISSFAKGRNFPVNYPHFANDGIAYHFFFYFLCGNLHYLGLPIDLAMNLPSIITFVAFCVLLGLLAISITKQKTAFFLAPYLLIFRSSFAFLTRLRDLWQQSGATFASVMHAIMETRTFIGDTPRDDWGLWGLNVYANQRHLLLGLSSLIVVLFLFLPLLLPSASGAKETTEGAEASGATEKTGDSGADRTVKNAGRTGVSFRLRQRFSERSQWLPQNRAEYLRLAAALVFAILLPYFHGSALVALLLILAGLMLFSRAWLAHISFAVVAIVSAFLQGQFFRSGGLPLEPEFFFGFIAEERTFRGVLAYLFEMSGLVLPLALLAAVIYPAARRLLFAFSLPLLFGFTFSLTPDVTVNHKYLIVTFALAGCLTAGLLADLWQRRGRLRPAGRVLAIFLLLVLSLTGWMELIVFRNINQIRVRAALNSPLVAFVESRTPPQSVFVTGPLSYHSLFFTGRQVYFGHAYYAWSAGHATFEREEKIKNFLAAEEEDPLIARNFISTENLDYLMIDDELRSHPEYYVNEDFFLENFAEVASFPSLGNMIIIDLHS